jgi:hypothetical protein
MRPCKPQRGDFTLFGYSEMPGLGLATVYKSRHITGADLTNYIRCRIEDQSHYVEATLLASLVLRTLDDQLHAYAVENVIRILIDVGRVRENRAAWINAFGFSPTSADAVEFVLSQASPPADLKGMLSRLVLSRPPIHRIGVGHLLVGSDGVPDANGLKRMAALQHVVSCLPRMRDDLISREDGWKYVSPLGRSMMFWRDVEMVSLVPFGSAGWIQ